MAASPGAVGSQVLPFAAIGAAAFCVYANSLHAPFVFDDHRAIKENPHIRQWRDPIHAVSAPIGSATSGRPLVALSFALNYAVGGIDPFGYRVVNVALHGATGMALFALSRRLIRATPRGPAAPWGSTAVALTIALLWTVHPLTTDAVNHVVYRTEVMMALFYLLTLNATVRAGVDARRRVWRWLAPVLCACGMASKEVMASAPLTALLIDRAFIAASWREVARRRGLYIGLALTWIVLAACMLMGHRGRSTGMGSSTRFDGVHVGIYEYALLQLQAHVHYLKLAVWPAPLVFDLGDWTVPTRLADSAGSAAIILGLLVATAVALRRAPRIGVLASAWWLILAPTSSLFPLAGEVVAEHRVYLPLAVAVGLVVVGACRIMQIAVQPLAALRPRAGSLALAVAAGLMAMLGGLTVRRNLDYRTEEALWRDTLGKRPNSARAAMFVGNALAEQGRHDAALEFYERSVRIAPRYAHAYRNYGNSLAHLKRFPEAERALRAALDLVGQELELFLMLGDVLALQGRLEDAAGSYRAALAIDPGNERARTRLEQIGRS